MQEEFDRIQDRQLNYFEKFFNMIQIMSFSNNMENEINFSRNLINGSFYSTPNKEDTEFYFIKNDSKHLNNYNYLKVPEEKRLEVIIDCGYKKEDLIKYDFERNLETTTPCNRFITSIFDKNRLSCLIKNGIQYTEKEKLGKHIKKYTNFSNEIKIYRKFK